MQMRKTLSSLTMLGLLALAACRTVPPAGQPGAAGETAVVRAGYEMFKPVPAAPPELAGNSITPDKVELGKMLYFDPRLSQSWLISCNTCHNLSLGGVDLQQTSIGHGWRRGGRNAPTVLNSVFNVAQFWDGRAKDLQEQAKGPVQAAVEMHNRPERVVETLRSIPEYVAWFGKAFPGEADPVTFDNMARAIEVFEATLLTPGSKFDQYLTGADAALSEQERVGLDLFVGKGCGGCHNGVNVGGGGYFPFGVVKKPGADLLPPGDKGRFAVTKAASDEYSFKVPSLRNIVLTAPYFHTGAVWNLEEAVAVMGSAQLGAELTPQETAAIAAFLGTLSGTQPVVQYPVLPVHTATTAQPEPGPAPTGPEEH